MLKVSLLRRFLNAGKQGDLRPSSVFLDRVPERNRRTYGEHALVACNGAGLVIIPERFYERSMLDSFPRDEWGPTEKTPNWGKAVMSKIEPSPALVPMTLWGRAVSLRGSSPKNPSVMILSPSWNSHPSKWVQMNVLYFDMARAVGAKISQASEDKEMAQNVYPLVGRAQSDGPLVCLGGFCPVRGDNLKLEQEEFFARVIADDTGAKHAAVQA